MSGTMDWSDAPWEEGDNEPSAVGVTQEGDVVPIHSLVQLKEDMGTVGEEYSYLVIFLTAAGGGGMVAVTGPSRSGKDKIVDAVEEGFEEPFAAIQTSSGSEAGIYRSWRTLNQAAVHRYEDMVDLNEEIENVMKMHGEGSSASRTRGMAPGDSENSVPSMGYEVTGENRVRETLFPPRAQIFFLADDNDRTSLSDFKEVENRAIVIPTDASQDLTEKIQDRQIDERMLNYEPNLNPQYRDEVRNYVSNIPHNEWEIGAKENGTTNPDFYNPGLGVFKDEHPIPPERVESRFDSWRLLDFMEIVALWHHPNRMTTEIEYKGVNKERMLITPKDIWLTQRIYGKKLIMSALSLQNIDLHILRFLRETGERYDVSELTQILSQSGSNVTTKNVRNSLDSMFENNYVNKDTGGNGNVEFYAAPFASVVEDYNAIDYEKVIEGSKKEVRDRLPTDVAEEYVRRFCEGPAVTQVVHPVTGETCDIRQYEGFKAQVEAQKEKLEEMVATSMYESDKHSRTDSDDGTAPEGNTETDGSLGSFDMG